MTVDKNWSIPSTSILFQEAEKNETVQVPANGLDIVKCSNKSVHSFDSDKSQDDMTNNSSDLYFEDNRSIFFEDSVLTKHHYQGKRSSHGCRGLCSIPEDQNVTTAFFLLPCQHHTKDDDEDSAYEDDEPTYHRSPVSLENGYRPAATVLQLRIFQGPTDECDSEGGSTSDNDFKIEFEFSTRTSEFRETAPAPLVKELPVVVRLLVWLLHLLVGLLVISVCLISVLLIILLSFHHCRHSGNSASPSYSSSPFLTMMITTTASTLTVTETLMTAIPPPSYDIETTLTPESVEESLMQQDIRKTQIDLNKADDAEKVMENVPERDERYVVKAVPKVFVQNDIKDGKAKNDIAEKADVTTNDVPIVDDNLVKQDEEQVRQPTVIEIELPVASTIEATDNNNVTATDDTTNGAVDMKVPETPNKTEPEIPSFREWTQKALEEEQKKREEERKKRDEEREKKKQQQQQQQQNLKQSNVGNSTATNGNKNSNNAGSANQAQQVVVPVRLKKNFASPDCGAKIVAANPESQGAPNVLTSYRDEYMLNKCSDNSWFVIELCESIKALKIEIANFELYSSVPHEFKVSLGNAFPAREKDWTTFGMFKAEDERTMQSFSSEGDVFGKFVKVEVMSHHGSEHYCPISQFKIFGISEIELIGSDDDDDDDDTNDDIANAASSNNVVSSNNNVLKFIREKMGETLEKVVGVFKPKDQNSDVDMQQALNKTSLEGTTFAYEISCPGCTSERNSDVYFLLATNFGKMSNALKHTNIRAALTRTRVCENYGMGIGHKAENTGTTNIVRHTLVNFYMTLFGTSHIVALCNVLAIEQGLGKVVRHPSKVVSNQTSDKNDTSMKDEEDQKDIGVSHQKESDLTDPKLLLASLQIELDGRTVDSTVTSTAMLDVAVPASLKEENAIVSEMKGSSEKIGDIITPTPVSQTVNGASPSASILEVASKEQEMKDLPDVVLVPPADSLHIHLDEEVNTGNGQKPVISGQGGRESVWQKLSNRIKTLERNVTLSSGYLEELSVQYKKQIEDLQMSMRQASESLTLLTKNREKDQFAMRHLQNEVSNLSTIVVNLTVQMETLRTWAIVAHIIVLIAEATIGGIFLIACYRRLKHQNVNSDVVPALASIKNVSHPIVVHVNGALQMSPSKSSTPLKRGFSLEDLGGIHDDAKNPGMRRRSLDNALSNGFVKVNGNVSADVPLTRKQRRRLQRRLSAASKVEQISSAFQERNDDNDDFWKQDEREWTPVMQGGSVDRTTPPALETVTTLPNGRTFVTSTSSYFSFPTSTVSTSNTFGILNSSLHDDPTPVKERSLNYRQNCNEQSSSTKKLKFSPEIVDHVFIDPNHLAAPKQLTAHRAGSFKRSKSTSPTRSKNQAAKQRDIFKHFNPETAHWIKH